MENKNTGVKVLIVVLILLVVGLSSFILYDKVLKDKNGDKDKTKETDKKDNKEKKDYTIEIDESYDNYVRNEYTTELNGEEAEVVTIYYYNNTKNDSDDYDLFMETFVNGVKVIDAYHAAFYENEDDADSKINELETEFDLSTIKDSETEEEYLVIDYATKGYECPTNTYLIVDSNGKKIDSFVYADECGSSKLVFDTEAKAESEVIIEAIEEIDGEYQAFVDQKAYIGDDEIYYVETYDCRNVEYRKKTIENGKIKDVNIKTFTGDVVGAAGAC